MGQDLLLRDPREFSLNASSRVPQLESHLLQEEEEDWLRFELYAEDVLIKDQKYQAVLPEEVVNQLNHLSSQQKQHLQLVFEKYKWVFYGKLGKHPTAKIDIELECSKC